ncbi:MAG: transglycosylase domain-containing protein, partial [Myxococcales bacterium]|nr:transglycosylase domain-containing protein [Myxococcales bacterium]
MRGRMRGAVTGAVNARWFVRRALQGALLGLVAVFVAVVVAVATYEVPRAELDPTRGGPLVVVDRRGEVLRAVPSVGGRPGREAWVRLDDVPSAAVLTLLASEDHRFFEHHGVDPLGIARALWLDVTRRGQRYGGSTITMQLAKMLHSSGERRTLGRKLVEMRAAFGLERELSKSEILEQYLNRVYFGRGAYG